MPVMEDDALLMEDYESNLEAGEEAGDGDGDTAEVAALKAELAMVKEAFAIYRASSEQALLGGMRADELRWVRSPALLLDGGERFACTHHVCFASL